MTTSTRNRDLALLVLRLVVGFVFFFHGSQKLFGWFSGYGLEATGQWMSSIGIPFGTFSALLAGLAEFAGGLALLTGAGVRLAAAPLAITMLVAGFTAHGSAFSITNGGMEYTLVLAAASVALGLLGPGAWTVPALTARLAQRKTVSAQGLRT